MHTSSRFHFSTSNSSFSARVKNRLCSSARLGLTGLGLLALAVAVSASSSKHAAQSKTSIGIDAASSSLVAQSSKTVAALPIVCTPCPAYITTTSQDVIVPSTTATDIGNHCDDCTTDIALPFAVTLYGTSYPAGTLVHASSNGSLEFGAATAPFGPSCPLPDSRVNRAILPFQGDLRTDNFTLVNEGIFTSVSGTAPSRTFNIEWRAEKFSDGTPVNFELILHEDTACFDVIYGVTSDTGSAEESGVQKSAAGPAVQFSCLAATLTPGLKVTYCPNPNCLLPVPTSAVSRKVHGAAGTFDIDLPLVPLLGAVGIEDRQQGATGPAVLWYNGDFDGVNGLANENNTAVGQSSVYDNFVVTDPNGWDLSAVFSNNLSTTGITGATWEIRSGVSAGNGGILVASGSTLSPTVTPTGRSGFGFTEYQVKVTGLSVHLPQLPAGQFYWLNVTPMCNGTGRSFDSTTSGANAIGMPPGNDMNAFFNSAQFGNVFTPTSDPTIGQPYDFSMGVIGGTGGYNHQIVVTFPNPVAVDSVAVTAGNGSVAKFSVSGNVVTIDLTGVTNAQRLGVTLGNVCDGNIAGDVLIPMGVLAGDVTANGLVNSTDTSLVQAQSGKPVTSSTFRMDVNANGLINSTDTSIVQSKSGTGL